MGERFTGLPFFDDTDVPPLDRTSVWTTKGTSAPGAAMPAERLAALEVMGIDRQLVLPQVVMASMAWQHDEDASAIRRAYNDAVIDWTSQGGGRLRPTALLSAHDLDDAVARRRAGDRRRLPGGAAPGWHPHGRAITGLGGDRQAVVGAGRVRCRRAPACRR